MRKFYFLIFFIALLILKATLSFSQPGTLDASFGNGGKVITPVGNSSSVANAVAIAADGKIVVGGYSFIGSNSVATLLQYNSDGSPDTSFGIGGKAILYSVNSSAINSIALQLDGKIVAGGIGNFDFLIARYNENGILDSSFGVNGIAPVIKPDSIGYAGSSANKVIIKPDGKILVGGELYLIDFENYAFILSIFQMVIWIAASVQTDRALPVQILFIWQRQIK